MICKFCESKATAKGMCSIHYGRWYRTGNPDKTQQGARKDVKSISERMILHREVQSNGCWYWTAGINQYGYGKVKYDKRTLGAHTVSWYLATGEWPEHELDHICHTIDKDCVGGVGCKHRRCINPEHLEPVTKPENTRRRDVRIGLEQSERIQKEIKRKHSDECGKGHKYTEDNTRLTPNGHRACRTCAREYAREYRQR